MFRPTSGKFSHDSLHVYHIYRYGLVVRHPVSVYLCSRLRDQFYFKIFDAISK